MGHRRVLGIAGGAALVAALVAGPAGPAAAHAALVSSNPEPGERLSSAPGVVVLAFGEPLVERLSEATVRAPQGNRFEARPDDGAARRIRVPVRTNARGVYEVRWRTVSPLDGHTLEGGFRFGVGVDVGPGVTGSEGTPEGSDLVLVPFRLVEDVALLLMLGSWLLGRLGQRVPPLGWVPSVSRPAALVALSAGIMVVGGEALSATDSWSPGGIVTYLTAGRGSARLARLGAEGLAVVFISAGRPNGAGVAGVAGLTALAASGHAGAVSPAWWGTAAQAFHLVAAGLWVGGILRLATLRPPDGWRGDPARELLRRFTAAALPAFAITVSFGVLRAVEELHGVSDLWSSSYGVALAAKVTAVAAMVPLSVRAWQRHALPRIEAGLGVAAITLAALLAAFPLPPRRAAEAEAASTAAAPSPALPRPGDLTFGLAVGDQLVGLTLRPGSPGVNDLYLLVVPTGTESVAPRLLLVVGRQHLRLEGCGPTCRHVRADLAGDEVIRVHTPGDIDEGAEIQLPGLPAPDGEALLGRLSVRMDALRSYHVEETLGPVDPPLRAAYDFEAPDRMHFLLQSTGQENVRVGERFYSRARPGAGWEASDAPPIDVHEFVWDQPRQRAARIVGEEVVDRVPNEIVAFFAETAGGTRLWFRLWVDGDGLVRRAAMLAEGHFMEHRYSGFDEPVDIEPPSVSSG